MHKENESYSERGLMTTTKAAHYLGVKPSYLYKMMMRRAIHGSRDELFRCPQWVQASAFQFSEIGLAVEWNTGRKRVHNLLSTMDISG